MESRVLGDFPAQADGALIPLTLLEKAALRPGVDSGDLSAGIDVAGGGEAETVLVVRRGISIVEIKAWTHDDPRGALVESLTPYKGKLKYVNVDSAGIGYGMAKHLKDFGFPIREVNVGSAPKNKERFFNLKAELCWGFLERAKAGDLAGLTDEKTIAQLASIRYELTSRGQVAIEKKENSLKRGVKSPDRADAVILAFAGILIEGAALIEYYENLTKPNTK